MRLRPRKRTITVGLHAHSNPQIQLPALGALGARIVSTPIGAPRFKNYGDWLIWRSSGIAGDFRMQACIATIASDGAKDGWLDRLTEDDINRILARYKEHVNFWNIPIGAIQRELDSFANALGPKHSLAEITQMFDILTPKRIPAQMVFSHAQVKKEVFFPLSSGSGSGTWIPSPFVQDEINRIQGWLVDHDSGSSVKLIAQDLCEMRGSFTSDEILSFLHMLQETTHTSQGMPFRYEVLNVQ